MVDTPEQGVPGVVGVADPQEVISLHRPDHHPSHALVIAVLCFDSKGLIIVITNPLITPARKHVQSDRAASPADTCTCMVHGSFLPTQQSRGLSCPVVPHTLHYNQGIHLLWSKGPARVEHFIHRSLE